MKEGVWDRLDKERVSRAVLTAFGSDEFMGLLAEMQIRTYHESQNKPIYVVKETAESPA